MVPVVILISALDVNGLTVFIGKISQWGVCFGIVFPRGGDSGQAVNNEGFKSGFTGI